MNPEPVTEEDYRAPHELERFLYLDDLSILNELKSSLSRSLCMNDSPLTTELGIIALGSGRRTIRLPDQTAMVTEVQNFGGTAITIYEDGIAICIIPPGEIKKLPMRGTGLIEADAGLSSAAINVTITKRSSCGDPPSSAAPDGEPIGSFLL